MIVATIVECRNKFQPEYLQSVFVECMLENKFEFVNLLLDCGVTMEMFKNVVVLEQLFIYVSYFIFHYPHPSLGVNNRL